MRKTVLLVFVALLALAVGPGAAWAQGGISIVTLNAQNGSGESGQATLTSIDATHTRVEVTLSGGPADVPQPAHIHDGSCANLNPVPKYPLTNVVNGASTTIVPVALTDLLGGKFAINVHKSAAEVSVYVACGDITALSSGGTGGTGPVGMPTTGAGNEGPLAGLAGLVAAALLLAGWRLRRRTA